MNSPRLILHNYFKFYSFKLSPISNNFTRVKIVPNDKWVRIQSRTSSSSNGIINFELKELNLDTIKKLEKLSLVEFGNEYGVKRLKEAVNFASIILEVNTENVKPLYTVLEDSTLSLRQDTVEPTVRESILQNASLTEEHYFVAPPANKHTDNN